MLPEPEREDLVFGNPNRTEDAQQDPEKSSKGETFNVAGDEDTAAQTKKNIIYASIIVLMLLALICMFKGTCACGKKVETRQMARVDSVEIQQQSQEDQSAEITVKT